MFTNMMKLRKGCEFTSMSTITRTDRKMRHSLLSASLNYQTAYRISQFIISKKNKLKYEKAAVSPCKLISNMDS